MNIPLNLDIITNGPAKNVMVLIPTYICIYIYNPPHDSF